MAIPLKSAASAAASAAKAATPLTAIPSFIPRDDFPVSPSIVRSYFLGHHHSALETMRRTLSTVGLVIECRDYRVPLTSWNPLLERTLSATSNPDRSRIIVYTKRDRGPPDKTVDRTLQTFHLAAHHAAAVAFIGLGRDPVPVLDALKHIASTHPAPSLTGLRALVVGMPNAGKSTLLNRLRSRGMGKNVAKSAKTGREPGVTRKLGTPVRILDADASQNHEGVYVVDTPGVFIPYVSDPMSMLKLSLVGCVKDGLVPPKLLADYLLYRLNLQDPGLYSRYCMPTNDVDEFLDGVALRTGKILKGGVPDGEKAADWIVTEWRNGKLGQFILDEVNDETLEAAIKLAREPPLSMNQAVKREKEQRKARNEAKRVAAQGG